MTAAAFGQTASTQQTKPEHFSKRQLNSLIATAKTPAEHQRIAQYYQAKSQDYLAQAEEHEQMVAAYKANPSLTAKSQASTINHASTSFRRSRTWPPSRRNWRNCTNRWATT
jgi:hypothetical protein